MRLEKLLIANRGEIAIRIARAAAELGLQTVAVCPADDSQSLHTKAADKVLTLDGMGAASYLNGNAIIAAAKAEGCGAIHPGYGFLSENMDFAKHCADEGIIFIGPTPDMLGLFGNKVEARALARRLGVPLLPGTSDAATLEEAVSFFKELGPDGAVMVKAIAGGGGRGMRPVYDLGNLEEAYHRCQSEAFAAFGNGNLFVEKLIRRPRHIEIQVVGDGRQVIHLGERDCTMQRRNQKLIEIAPCPTLSSELRNKLTDAALRLSREVKYQSLGTFEFLIDETAAGHWDYAFMEVNPRLQVEHTITEEVTGVDLVKTQIEIASGKTLADLGLTEESTRPRGYAVQLRINMETMDGNGDVMPDGGVLSTYEVPSGKDIRVDGYGYSGYTVNPAFDSLLAKLIVHSSSPRYEDAVKKAYRALGEFRIGAVATNIPFLQNLLCRPEVIRNDFHTRFIEENAAALAAVSDAHRLCHFEAAAVSAAVDRVDIIPPGLAAVKTSMQGRIVDIDVVKGAAVTVGQKLAVMEAMKMEHIITADRCGYIQDICVAVGDTLRKGALLFLIEEAEVAENARVADDVVNLDAVRPDLAEVMERHAFTRDENRPDAVARRRKKNRRTARENVEDLCDPGTFIEYGALIVAAQRRRRPMDDLIRKTPADGLITGVGAVNGTLFSDEKSSCMVMAYDFTVLAGTQGLMNHKKMDRVLHVASKWKLPLVLFAEGGGGRPGDTDIDIVSGLDLTTFSRFAALSGKVPLVGIVEGSCFAGNAALLGCCDVIIATEHSNIGMGGPAMIEGGGLGVFKPEDIGPIDIQTKNGVVDLAVADEVSAVAAAKQYLSYFQGITDSWEAADQRHLRRLIPENRLRVYDVRKVIEALADTGSVLELRRHFGLGMITALIRIEGRPFGVIANDPAHMSGAIEAEGADKAARFMQLCNIHGLPILSLCDTPGFMVGPEVEERAQVRHVCRMFIVGANVTVPFFTVVLRKGYGLGAMAMSAGSFHDAFFTAAWPSGEFGGMGLEGAVRVAFKKELEAIKNEVERDKAFKEMVDQFYAMGKAINMASYMEIDAVIDPADTRRWIMRGLKSVTSASPRENRQLFMDAW
ncbi:MAG: carbamoyl-phosphate synthase large subunit [Deltaproteobacteria bacterium HGW-Deltaproteobacteria-6]|nr:MAG: carbamoyl-phosphate synthase large subunit [Deltaproteobacteria bacterium HGW-Deltaproteobacteria-6]